MINVRINILNLHFCELITDTTDLLEYTQTTDKIPGLMEVSMNTKLSEGKLYGDGAQRHTSSKKSALEIKLQHNKIPYSILNKYTGTKKDTKGVYIDNVKDKSKYFALGYEVETSDGKELIWLYKCIMSPSERKDAQSTDNINYSTDSYTITAMPLEHDGNFRAYLDTGDVESGQVDQTVVTEWFLNPYKPILAAS